MPRAEKYLALWVDNFKCSYLRLIAIGHYYPRPDRQTCVPDPFDKEFDHMCRRA